MVFAECFSSSLTHNKQDGNHARSGWRAGLAVVDVGTRSFTILTSFRVLVV